MAKRKNGEGSVRKVGENVFEAIVQSSILNPQTGNYKRFKRRGTTEEAALTNAKMACSNWELEMSYGNDVKVDKSKTFGMYMKEWMENVVRTSNITASTYFSYTKNLDNMFYKYDVANLQLQMLNPKVFEDYYNLLLSKYSKKSCGTPRQMCIRLCDYLVDKQLIQFNYAKLGEVGIKQEVIDEFNKEKEDNLKAQKKIWSNEDIQKFYDAYRTGTGGEIVIIILFMIEVGIRPGEFVSITNDNIDFEHRLLHIEKAQALRYKNSLIPEAGIEYYTKTTKGREERDVYLSDFALELIEVMQTQTKSKCKCNKEDLLYPQFRKGTKRTNTSLEICCKDLCNKLGIDRDVRVQKGGQKRGLNMHTCRHTYDSIANNAKDANPIATALTMGHKSINTQNIYTHITEDARKQIKTASSEVLGINTHKATKGQIETNNKVIGGLTEEEEKLLYELLKKKYGE